MLGFNFDRLVMGSARVITVAAVVALCCGTSFAAGPKMAHHKVAKISNKANMTHTSSKRAKLGHIEQNLSDEELFRARPSEQEHFPRWPHPHRQA